MNRTAYNKLHYEVQRTRNAMLKKYKEEHPERFAELLKQAQADIDKPVIHCTTSYTLSQQYTPIQQYTPTESEIQEKIAQIDSAILAFRNGRKSFYINVDGRHLFENHFNENDILQKYPGALVTPCTCPLCVRGG